MVQFAAAAARDISLVHGGRLIRPAAAGMSSSPSPSFATIRPGAPVPYLDFIEQPRVTADGVPYTSKVSVEFRPTDGLLDDRGRSAHRCRVYEDGCA